MIYTCRHCFQTMRRWANVILTSLQVWVVLCLRGVRSIAKRIRFKLEGHVSTFENDFHPATAKPVFSRTRRRRRRCRLHHPRNRYTRPPPLPPLSVATTGAYNIIIISFVELYKRNLRLPVPRLDSSPYYCVVFFK